MRPTLLGGFLREECGACRAVWFEGGSLAEVMGNPALVVLVRKALGKPGECKHCQTALGLAPSCPSCGADVSRCPQCGTGPLAVATAAEVPVDVCTGCRGVGLDAGELELLLRAAKEAPDPWPLERDASTPQPEPEPPDSHCARCRRELEPEHAFSWEGKTWCGSCAPRGASPVKATLTPYDPWNDEYDDLASSDNRLRGRERRNALPEVEGALMWFFSKLLG